MRVPAGRSWWRRPRSGWRRCTRRAGAPASSRLRGFRRDDRDFPADPAVPRGSAGRQRSCALAVVDELQRDPEVRLLQQRDHALQVVLLLAADPQLVALDLRLDAARPLVTDLLADLL